MPEPRLLRFEEVRTLRRSRAFCMLRWKSFMDSPPPISDEEDEKGPLRGHGHSRLSRSLPIPHDQRDIMRHGATSCDNFRRAPPYREALSLASHAEPSR